MSSRDILPGDPAVDAFGPLTDVDDETNRGKTAVLCPPFGDEPSIVDLVHCRSRTARGQVLGVVLGLKVLKEARPTEELADASVVALLEWGLGGVTFHAECDFLNGTQIGVVAETLRVRAKYVRTTPPWDIDGDEEDECPPTFQVSGGVGYYGIGRNSNSARLTKKAQVETPGGFVDVEVPPYAISFTVELGLAATTASILIVGRSLPYATPVSIVGPMTNAGQHDVENAFPLKNTARFLRVTNTNVAGPLFADIVFGLTL